MTGRSAALIEFDQLCGLIDATRDHWAPAGRAWDRLVYARDHVARCGDPGSERYEIALRDLSESLRRCCLVTAHQCADRHLRSPRLDGSERALPSGERFEFCYERTLPAGTLERRVARGCSPPTGWHAEHVVVNSGMSALSLILNCYLSMTGPSEGAPIRAAVIGGYFETSMVYELYRSAVFTSTRYDADGDLGRALSGVDLLHLEPVSYDWDLTPIDFSRLVRALRSTPGPGPRLVLVDTTLVSFTWPSTEFLTALNDGRPPLVVEYRSGLKLDQQGLEIANAGIISVYSANRGPSTPSADQFANRLRAARGICGVSLGFDAIAALDAPFLLDDRWTRRHAAQVFANNAAIAGALAGIDGIFAKIAHPSLARATGPPWDAPFVVCTLAEDDLNNHGLLLAVIRHEAREAGMLLDRGASFGFRTHRYETIVPKDRRGLFKIAAGSRGGRSHELTIDLFRELASYPDFDALRRAYPRLEPIRLPVD